MAKNRVGLFSLSHEWKQDKCRGVSGILPVGMVMCSQAGEHNEAAFSDSGVVIRG